MVCQLVPNCVDHKIVVLHSSFKLLVVSVNHSVQFWCICFAVKTTTWVAKQLRGGSTEFFQAFFKLIIREGEEHRKIVYFVLDPLF